MKCVGYCYFLYVLWCKKKVCNRIVGNSSRIHVHTYMYTVHIFGEGTTDILFCLSLHSTCKWKKEEYQMQKRDSVHFRKWYLIDLHVHVHVHTCWPSDHKYRHIFDQISCVQIHLVKHGTCGCMSGILLFWLWMWLLFCWVFIQTTSTCRELI